MKYSTSKISPAKLNSGAGTDLVNTCNLRKCQKKDEEICHGYYMRLRSGLIIKKETCYFRKEPTKKCSLKTKRKHQVISTYDQPTVRSSFFRKRLLQVHDAPVPNMSAIHESCASLSTFNDQSISFDLEDGKFVINVDDVGKHQEKDNVLLRYYESPFPKSEAGDEVDGRLPMVNLSPTKDTGIWLHANNKKHSVELQKGQTPLPEQAFFVLHKDAQEYVSFECKSNRGTYIGVKDNQLTLVGKNTSCENIMFKLSM